MMGHWRSQSSAPLLLYRDESPSLIPFIPDVTFGGKYRPSPRRAHLALLVVAVVVSFGLFASRVLPSDAYEYISSYKSNAPLEPVNNATQAISITEAAAIATTLYSPWVLGPPTQSFRDNLRHDRKYITSWYSAGWNNDVMTMMNLIYLAKITDRIPIIPTFTPSWHIGGDAPGITFGEIFDVPRFIEEADMELLEWYEVKDDESEEADEIGCWSVWRAAQHYEDAPRGSDVPKWLNLDISYTTAPEWIKSLPDYPNDPGSSFWALARLAYPEDRNKNLGRDILPSPLHGALLDPDEDLLCYDYLYYVGAHQWLEYDFEYAPAWRDIGTNLHWTGEMKALADQYLNRAFGLPVNQPPPPYIAVHVRHGDFKEWCWDAEKVEDCFAPLPVISRRVNEVQTEIFERHGIVIPDDKVIITSDETDETWWQEVALYGWVRMNHDEEKTAERYSRWHPLILDSVIQSNGLGFVGTDRSTFSTLSRRRVLDWNDGVVRMVRWGKKGADDH